MQQTTAAVSKGFKNLQAKLTGQKYHQNLLGESLEDMLRIATAKTLEAPDATLNQQIVETINNEVAAGKDPKDVVGLLKARLRMDNPHKQFLAVKLLEQVLTDCAQVLAAYQQELLVEAARVMTKPSKPETEAGKIARQAAKELLRKYGQEGTTAFRAVHNEGRTRPAGGAVPPPGYPQPAGYPAGYPPPAAAYGVPAAYGSAYPQVYPPPQGQPQPGGMNIESQSLIDEVRLLIDKAKSNTELLSDMLVSSSGTPDDFETELIKDLATEVRELRELFNAYLEQIGSIEDPAMEVLLVQALEAVDMLDGAIALQKDVALNQQEAAAAAARSGPSTSGPSGAAAGAGAGPAPSGATSSSTPAAAPKPAANADLIALDELAEAFSVASVAAPQGVPAQGAPAPSGPSAGGASQAYDPFAASDLVPIFPGASGPSTAAPAPAPAPAGQQQTPASPFTDSAFPQPTPSAAPAYPPAAAAAPYPQYAAYPAPGAYPPQGAPAPYPGAPPPAPVAAAGPPGGLYGLPAYPPTQGYAAPPAPPASQYGAPQYGGPPAQYPPADPFSSLAAPKGSNPFQAGADPAVFLPAPPTAGASNPFAAASGAPAPVPAPAPAPAAAPAPGPAPAGPSVDHEWELFFADRAAGAPQAPKPT